MFKKLITLGTAALLLAACPSPQDEPAWDEAPPPATTPPPAPPPAPVEPIDTPPDPMMPDTLEVDTPRPGI
jgi:hypothetical protein